MTPDPKGPAMTDQSGGHTPGAWAHGEGIRINGRPATADDVIAIGQQMDADDGGYPAPKAASEAGEVERLREALENAEQGLSRIFNILPLRVSRELRHLVVSTRDRARAAITLATGAAS